MKEKNGFAEVKYAVVSGEAAAAVAADAFLLAVDSMLSTSEEQEPQEASCHE